MMLLFMILLVALPYGTALICGAITYRAGDDCLRLVQRGRSRPRHLFLSQEHGAAWPELRRPVPQDMINCSPVFVDVLSIPEHESGARVASYRLQH